MTGTLNYDTCLSGNKLDQEAPKSLVAKKREESFRKYSFLILIPLSDLPEKAFWDPYPDQCGHSVVNTLRKYFRGKFEIILPKLCHKAI